MNIKTNFYGAIGLASTIGKNGFALGQSASRFGAGACYYTRQVVEVNVLGYNAFEKLENASKWSEKRCKSATTTCKEWETWAQQKYEKAKKEEDWEEVNKTYANVEAEPKVHINLEEDQSCLRNWNNNSYQRTNVPRRISKGWIKQVYSKNYHQFLFNNLFTKTF